MDELITTYHDQLVTTSRDIAEAFGKEHKNVLRDIDSLKKDVLNFEQMFFEAATEDTYGRAQRTFYVNRDGFSLLAMGFTGSNALQWKLKYIDAFNLMEKELNTPEKIMARALKVAEETLADRNKKIEEMKPKADFYDSVADSKTAIQIGDVAKMLGIKGIGRNNLFQLLRDKKILDRNNVPYQQYVDCGYFRVIEQKYTVAGEVRINIKTLVYQKGIDWIRRITEHEAIPKLEVE